MSEARKFFQDIVDKMGIKGPLGSAKTPSFWYNEPGDCIEFQTIDEAIVADRIDDYLTLFRTTDKKEAIGFKIKGIKSLVNVYGGHVGFSASGEGKRVVNVSVVLMQAAQTEDKPTYKRITGYAEAVRTLSDGISKMGSDEVSLAECV